MTQITAKSWAEMFEGSLGVAKSTLARAIRDIDAEFGDGYAKAHPDLVGVYMQVAAGDFAAMTNAKVLGEALEQIADSVGRMSEVASG